MSAVPRPFRDPGTLTALNCLSCGAPIQIHTFGALSQVACQHCGSILGPDEAGRLAILEKVARARRANTLPLYARGHLLGDLWEVVGVMVRSTKSGGETYQWEEFLLFNPLRGFRYLVHNLWDHAWTFATPADAMATVDGGRNLWDARHGTYAGPGQRIMVYRGQEYTFFQRSTATVTYVEGEFPWEVRVGDLAHIDDYATPPNGLSVEFSQTDEDDGQELNLTELRYLDFDEVARAFGLTVPSVTGVPMLAPNPHRPYSKGYTIAFMGLFFSWIAVTIGYAAIASGKILASATVTATPAPTVVEYPDLEIGKGSGVTTVKVELSRPLPVVDWVSANVVLIPVSGDSPSYTIPVASASDFEGEPGEALLGNVRSGTYHVVVTLESGKGDEPLPGVPTPSVVPNASNSSPVVLTIRHQIFLFRYMLLGLFIVLLGPIIHLAARSSWETRRWENAD
jgi:ribosomal protein S27E